MGGWAVFSGANQFEWSEREATVTVKMTFNIPGETNARSLTTNVKVTQDPKIINPMGIWRRSDNNQPFNVVIQKRDQAEGNFSPLISDGPWKAYVEWGDKALVKLSALGESQKYGDTIRGKTNSKIEFRYTPVGTSTTTPRFAVIKIEFHNNSSHHYIFVRQGYQDVTIDGTTWSTFNLYTKDTRCVSPLSMGSFFRRGNMTDAILERTNKTYAVGANPKKFWVNDINKTISVWNGTGGIDWSDAASWNRGSSVKYKTPSYAQGKKLVEDLQGQFGFGIIYADGATEVATKADDAFGFYDPENKITSSTKGVRGVIYANKTSKGQVFFPIGQHGHGRRDKGNPNATTAILKFYNGELRYAGVSGELALTSSSANWYRPLAFDTYDQPGAIYWLSNASNSNYGIDINFRVWRFNYYGKDLLLDSSRGSDACPIKPVLN